MMDDQPLIPTPLQATLIIIASFFFALIFGELLLLPFMPDDPATLEKSSLAKLAIVLGEFGLIVLPLLFMKRKGFPIKAIFRWNPVNRHVVLIAIVIGFAMTIVGDELDRLINIILTPPEFLEQLEASLKINSSLDLILLFIGTVIIASLVEESVFRGFLQVTLENYQNVTKAVIYSSVFWALIHGILFWAVQIFLMGVILGYLAWRTKSIIPSAICHAINNGMALFFTNGGDTSGGSMFYSIYEWKGHVSPLILIPAIIILVKAIQFLDESYFKENSPPSRSGSE
jgi:membrane protease YdiL (CAAX protease family)